MSLALSRSDPEMNNLRDQAHVLDTSQSIPNVQRIVNFQYLLLHS